MTLRFACPAHSRSHAPFSTSFDCSFLLTRLALWALKLVSVGRYALLFSASMVVTTTHHLHIHHHAGFPATLILRAMIPALNLSSPAVMHKRSAAAQRHHVVHTGHLMGRSVPAVTSADSATVGDHHGTRQRSFRSNRVRVTAVSTAAARRIDKRLANSGAEASCTCTCPSDQGFGYCFDLDGAGGASTDDCKSVAWHTSLVFVGVCSTETGMHP